MTPEAADWVYAAVLTQRYREACGAVMWTGAREQRRDEGRGAAFLRKCACQYGPCGKPCAWLCPTVRLGQLELFALAGGVR